jgi:hypothetical protein
LLENQGSETPRSGDLGCTAGNAAASITEIEVYGFAGLKDEEKGAVPICYPKLYLSHG